MLDRSAHDVFVDKAYRDTLRLLEEVRDYVAGPLKDEAVALVPQVRATLMHELSKVTLRLTDAMAWLLLQKAVAADEIDAEAAAERAAGASQEAGNDDGSGEDADLGSLPLAARGLIDRSRRVSAGVVQLETSLRKFAGR